MISPLVPVLFALGAPGTIPWLIIPVIVLSLNAVTFTRPWPHIGQEVPVARAPTPTDTNPATAVIVIMFIVGVGTALYHHPPNVVLGLLHAVALTVVRVAHGVVVRCSIFPALWAQLD